MKILQIFQKQSIVGIAAASAMHALMDRQQDLAVDLTGDALTHRVKQTCTTAVAFANGLWTELVAQGY